MASTRAISALTAAGVAHVVRRYRHTTTGAVAAAQALVEDPAQVAKTLVVDVDGAPWFMVLPGTVELSLKAAARAAGGRSAAMADPDVAQRLTGYVIGGISPLGSRRCLPVAIERALVDHPYMLINGGGRGVMVQVAPADLVALLDARVADLAVPLRAATTDAR